MLSTFRSNLNKPILFSEYSLLWVRSGSGLVEVDFRTYSDLNDKLIFLAPGQYVNFLSADLDVVRLVLPAHFARWRRDYRVLFKHLIALGHLTFPEPAGPANTVHFFTGHPLEALDRSTEHWYQQNPFRAAREEYDIIFDVKEAVDEHYRFHGSINELLAHTSHRQQQVQRVLRDRIGIGIKTLAQNKLVLESQRDIAFTAKPVQEIAYEQGFKDPAYFNRFFKKYTSATPLEFRRRFGDPASDQFVQDLLQLIREHHREQHCTAFYATRTFMSIKTLARKVQDRLHTTVGALIRQEILRSAYELLKDQNVTETAFALGFKEPNHFSAFFKKYAGQNPQDWRNKKYHS